MYGAAVTSATNKKQPYSAALSLVLATASWIALTWISPAAFACGLVFGLGAFLLGLTGYNSARASGNPFRPAFRSLTGASSGAVTAVLAVVLWALVWPEVAARQVQQEQAHSLLATILSQTNGTVATAAPQFSKPGGVYVDSIKFSLKGEGTNSIVCYTTDGSEPTARSAVYTSPIWINRAMMVKAKAFRPGYLPSSTASESYVLAERDLTNFTSNLPLVVIDTYGRHLMREPKTQVFARFIPPANGHSQIVGPADYSGGGEMHLRGSSTLRFPKRSLSFTPTSGSDKQKVSIFGLPKDSDWVLYAPYQDKTLMRDALAYELSLNMGHYSARTRFVEVFMNTGNGKISRGDYIGVYVFMEKIKRGKNRVNVEELTREDNSEPKISGGYIFKRDHNDRNEQPFYTRGGPYGGGPYYYVYPNERTITRAQKQWLQNYMNRFESALYGPDFMDPSTGYRAYLDVDSFIDQHWLIELSKNVDGFRYSCFLHKDRGGKLKLEPPWDWNLSFGNADYYGGAYTYSWYHTHLRPNEISWYRRLKQDPDFAQRCADRWAQLRKKEFSPDRILKRVDQMAEELQEAQARNFSRWGIMGQRVHANSYVGRTYRDEVNWMKRWIKDRIAWIDSQLLPAPKISVKQSPDTARTLILEESAKGTVYYTIDGSDPRSPGGSVSPQATAYSGPVSINATAQICARAFQSQTWSSPTTIPGATASVESA